MRNKYAAAAAMDVSSPTVPPPRNPLNGVEAYLPDAEHGLAACAAMTFYVLAVLWFLFTACTLCTRRRSTTRAQCYVYALVALAVATRHMLCVLGERWPDVVLTPLALFLHAAVCTLLWLDVRPSLNVAVLALTGVPALCAGVLLALTERSALERIAAALHSALLVALSYATLLALGLARRGLCRADLLADCGVRPDHHTEDGLGERGSSTSLWFLFTLAHLSPVAYVVLGALHFDSPTHAIVARLCCDAALLLVVPAVVVCYSATFGCRSAEPYYLRKEAALASPSCVSAASIGDDEL